MFSDRWDSKIRDRIRRAEIKVRIGLATVVDPDCVHLPAVDQPADQAVGRPEGWDSIGEADAGDIREGDAADSAFANVGIQRVLGEGTRITAAEGAKDFARVVDGAAVGIGRSRCNAVVAPGSEAGLQAVVDGEGRVCAGTNVSLTTVKMSDVNTTCQRARRRGAEAAWCNQVREVGRDWKQVGVGIQGLEVSNCVIAGVILTSATMEFCPDHIARRGCRFRRTVGGSSKLQRSGCASPGYCLSE